MLNTHIFNTRIEAEDYVLVHFDCYCNEDFERLCNEYITERPLYPEDKNSREKEYIVHGGLKRIA